MGDFLALLVILFCLACVLTPVVLGVVLLGQWVF